MTYLVHNETLFELHTPCSALTHFPPRLLQHQPGCDRGPGAAVQHPQALTLSDPQTLRCSAYSVKRSLSERQLTAKTSQDVLNHTTNPAQGCFFCTLIKLIQQQQCEQTFIHHDLRAHTPFGCYTVHVALIIPPAALSSSS